LIVRQLSSVIASRSWAGRFIKLLLFEKQERAFAVVRVAVMIAVDEVRPDLSQIALFDRLIALHAEGSRAGRPAIHQDESHVAGCAVIKMLGAVAHFGHLQSAFPIGSETRRIVAAHSIVRG
jgi:hypothetical protein